MNESALAGSRGRKRVILMRHGDVNYYRPGGKSFHNSIDITPEGEEQARNVGHILVDQPFDFAVHTGATRTIRTLELVLSNRNVPVREVREMREIEANPGDQLSPERWEAEFVYGFERAAEPGASFAGGEPFADFYARVIPAMEKIVLEPGWRQSLMVCHGGTNAVILAWITGGGLKGLGAFDQDAGCVNVLDFDVIDGQIIRKMIRAVNVTPYDLVKSNLHLSVIERLSHERAQLLASKK